MQHWVVSCFFLDHVNVWISLGRATVPFPNSGTRCVETSGRAFLKMFNHLVQSPTLEACETYRELVKPPIQTLLDFWVLVTIQYSLIPSILSWFTSPAAAHLHRIWGLLQCYPKWMVSCKAFICLGISCWPRAACYGCQRLNEGLLMILTLVFRKAWYWRTLLCPALWPASLEGIYYPKCLFRGRVFLKHLLWTDTVTVKRGKDTDNHGVLHS